MWTGALVIRVVSGRGFVSGSIAVVLLMSGCTPSHPFVNPLSLRTSVRSIAPARNCRCSTTPGGRFVPISGSLFRESLARLRIHQPPRTEPAPRESDALRDGLIQPHVTNPGEVVLRVLRSPVIGVLAFQCLLEPLPSSPSRRPAPGCFEVDATVMAEGAGSFCRARAEIMTSPAAPAALVSSSPVSSSLVLSFAASRSAGTASLLIGRDDDAIEAGHR